MPNPNCCNRPNSSSFANGSASECFSLSLHYRRVLIIICRLGAKIPAGKPEAKAQAHETRSTESEPTGSSKAAEEPTTVESEPESDLGKSHFASLTQWC